MGGSHRAGKHRKPPFVWRRAGQLIAIAAALFAIILAFLQPTRTVTNVQAIPSPPLLALTPSTTTKASSTTPTTTNKKKRSSPTTQRARRAALEKDQLDATVTPDVPPSIKVERHTEPPRVAPQARAVAPRPSQSPFATELKRVPSVVNRESQSVSTQSEKASPPKTEFKSAPKTTPEIRPTPRAAAPTLVKGSQPSQRITTTKPKTVSPAPPPIKITIPGVTTNAKCATLGLLSVPKAACSQILAAFPQVKSVLGVGSRAGNPTSCHPKGLAIDFIVGTNKALGDRLYAYVIARRSALGASPVILWQVPDHFDHVHVSFNPCKG